MHRSGRLRRHRKLLLFTLLSTCLRGAVVEEFLGTCFLRIARSSAPISIRREGSERWETAIPGSRWPLPATLQSMPSALSARPSKVELIGVGFIELSGRTRIDCQAYAVQLTTGRAILRLRGTGHPLWLSGGIRCEKLITASVPSTLIIRGGLTPSLLVHQGLVFDSQRSYRAGTALRWRWVASGMRAVLMRSWPRWSPPQPALLAASRQQSLNPASLRDGIPEACAALLRRPGVSGVLQDAAITVLIDLGAAASLRRLERWRPEWSLLHVVRAAEDWIIRKADGPGPNRSELPSARLPSESNSSSTLRREAFIRLASYSTAALSIEAQLNQLELLKREALAALAEALPGLHGHDSDWVFAALMELGNDDDQAWALEHGNWSCLRRCQAHLRTAAFHSDCQRVRILSTERLGTLGILEPDRDQAWRHNSGRPIAIPGALWLQWDQAVAACALGQDRGLRTLVEGTLSGESHEGSETLFAALLERGLSVWELEAFLQSGFPPPQQLKSWLKAAPALTALRHDRGAGPKHAADRWSAPWLQWLRARRRAVQRARADEQMGKVPWPLRAVLRLGGFTAFDIVTSRANAGDSEAQRHLVQFLRGPQRTEASVLSASERWRLAATLGVTWLPAGADFTEIPESLLW